MRLKEPRIAPLGDAEMTEDQKEAVKPFGNRVLNIFRTLAHAPKALTRFNEWGGYILSRRNDLAPREREIVILRTGFLCKSGYEWTQHVAIGKREGLTDDEIGQWISSEMLSRYGISIGGGTNEVQRNNLAERALGLPKEPTVPRDTPWSQLLRS